MIMARVYQNARAVGKARFGDCRANRSGAIGLTRSHEDAKRLRRYFQPLWLRASLIIAVPNQKLYSGGPVLFSVTFAPNLQISCPYRPIA